jgi:hypothetical protein
MGKVFVDLAAQMNQSQIKLFGDDRRRQFIGGTKGGGRSPFKTRKKSENEVW